MPDAIEPYSSSIVAAQRGIVLGKKSGLANIEIKVKELGLAVATDKFPSLLASVKEQATHTHRLVTDAEFAQMAAKL
jgi:isopropylmalate/homocitrate/citramalate synthase